MNTKAKDHDLDDEFEPIALGSISEETKGNPLVAENEGIFNESKIPD